MNRLDALAAEFGADTGPGADWGRPLPKMATEVYHEFTRPGGSNGYARFGRDVVTPAEIVNAVYEAWARSEHVSVEWFETRDNPLAMLRTFTQYAAQNVVNVNAAGSRFGVDIQPTGMTGAGIEDPGAAAESMRTPGAMAAKSYEWLVNSAEFASEDGNPEDDYDEAEALGEWVSAIEVIIEGIENPTHQALARRYYLEGDELDEAASALGMKREAGKKALQRARQALGTDLANALIVWRRATFPDSGRQPLTIEGGMPEVFAEALG
jgi:hypothetical protein